MMRSLYSAVSGLKTHQTRMDVIGNNIANVNTEAFKSSRVTFSEIMYQTTSQASGGNAATGVGGVNAKQIGLGVTTGATSISITTAGAAETTGNPFDLKLTDSQTTNFFIVSDGTNTMFTRSGSYYVDGNGFLCMTSTGYTLMGWQVDPTTGEIKKDTVSPLQVMSAKNQTSSPEATTLAQVSGILDKNDPNLKSSEDGYVMTLNFYDDLGYSYTARFSVKPINTGNESEDAGKYEVSLTDILDSNGKSYIDIYNSNVDDESKKITTDQLFSTETNRVFIDEQGREVYRTETMDNVYKLNVISPNTYYADANGVVYTAEELGNAFVTGPDGKVYYNDGTYATATQVLAGTEVRIKSFTDGTTEYDPADVTDDGNGNYTLTATGATVTISKYEDLNATAEYLTTEVTVGIDGKVYLAADYQEGEVVTAGTEANITALAVGEHYYFEDPANNDAKTITTEQVTPYYADVEKNQLFDLNVASTDPADAVFVFNDNGKQLIVPSGDVKWDTYDVTTGLAKDNLNRDIQVLPAGDYVYYEVPELDADGNETGNTSQYISEVHVEQYELIFDTNEGSFISIGGEDAVTLKMSKILSNTINQETGRMSNFEDISVDFSSVLNLNNGGTSTMGALKGIDGDGSGKKLGALTGISVDESGRVYGSYDNGNTTLLCQIAVAQFSNASGLEKIGDNCYQTTLNSGDFDGIGVEVSADGSSISTGELEMSNVDLSAQFTDMIITQRGFQANSRVITTSDTLLEELINLKR